MRPDEKTHLVLGAARSGKSRHAQTLAEAGAGRLMFIATAQAFDDEMETRIARHQADRDARWSTVEAPVELARAIVEHGGKGNILLIDCLTLWASNLLLGDEDIDARTDALLAAVAESPAQMIFVSNEVGSGIVPDNALARRFRNVAGTLNQRVAAACGRVDLVVAGIPLRLR